MKNKTKMSIPNELWEFILEFVQDWNTLYSVCQTQKFLWVYLQETFNGFYKYLEYETEKLAISQAKSFSCKHAIMDRKCQLCKRGYMLGVVQHKWLLYAHPACISKEVISIPRAIELYDLPYEKLITLPKQNNAVWKYHGGRTCLNFSVMSTIQGLCLMVCHENLHDRRARLARLRERAKDELVNESKTSETIKRKYESRYENDKLHLLSKKRLRLDETKKVKQLHLQPILVKYRIIQNSIIESFKHVLYETISMPKSWKQIEQIISVWSTLQHTRDFTDILKANPKLVLEPQSLSAQSTLQL
jgi:hypothetical protein